jgi:hypothetical protein
MMSIPWARGGGDKPRARSAKPCQFSQGVVPGIYFMGDHEVHQGARGSAMGRNHQGYQIFAKFLIVFREIIFFISRNFVSHLNVTLSPL